MNRDEEIERLRAELAASKDDVLTHSAAVYEATRKVNELRSELDALREDAERYRWMRIRCNRKGYNLSFIYAVGLEPTPFKSMTPEECDAAIDAARKSNESA